MPIISKIWITGGYGRLGSELVKMLDRREYELLTTDLDDVDVTRVDDVVNFADRSRPDLIIHCAGMTDADACEQSPEDAFRVNALGARNVALASRKIGTRLVHLSTDDVFGDGFGVPYTEFDTPSPTTVYGRSKLAGENFVRELAPKHIIIRSGWVYGTGHNFVTWLLEQAKQGGKIAVPNDQTGCPTSAQELARLVIRLMQTSEYGLYHGVCEGSCTRFAFAEEILRQRGLKIQLVPKPARELSNLPGRPSYTVLDNFMLRISDLHQMASWQTALAEYLSALPK